MSTLSEKSSTASAAKVPITATGIETLAIAVVVFDWRKNRFTSTTAANAIQSVKYTSSIDSRTKIVKSTPSVI